MSEESLLQGRRTALLHHWFPNVGGGERVCEALCEILHKPDVFTIVYRERGLGSYELHRVRQCVIQQLGLPEVTVAETQRPDRTLERRTAKRDHLDRRFRILDDLVGLPIDTFQCVIIRSRYEQRHPTDLQFNLRMIN